MIFFLLTFNCVTVTREQFYTQKPLDLSLRSESKTYFWKNKNMII